MKSIGLVLYVESQEPKSALSALSDRTGLAHILKSKEKVKKHAVTFLNVSNCY